MYFYHFCGNMKQWSYVKAKDTGKVYTKICFLLQIYVNNSVILQVTFGCFLLAGKIDVGFIADLSRISLFRYIVFCKPIL